MPMDFPDFRSLKFAARVHKFRDINVGERIDEYRNSLANYVAPIDFLESEEIRSGIGWNKWSDERKQDMLRRS